MVTGTFILLMVVLMIVCVMLTMVVLSQNPKGGGLSSTFGGGGSQMFGVQRTNDFLDKATWTLSGIIALIIILSNVMLPRDSQQNLLPEVPVQEQTIPATDDTNPLTVPSDNTTTQPLSEE